MRRPREERSRPPEKRATGAWLRRAVLALVAAVVLACASTGPPLPSGAVAFRLRSLDGEDLSLGSLRGRVVVVTVMATWADPALLEVPRLIALSERHAKAPFTVLTIALDAEEEAVRVFRDTFQVPYLVARVDEPDVFTSARGPLGPITLMPTSFVLEPDGTVASRMDGLWPPNVLEALVERLLAGLPESR